MNIQISITVSPKELAELISCLEEKGGSELAPNSVQKALEAYVRFEAESIASDPVAYASDIFTNTHCCSILEQINSLSLEEKRQWEEAQYQQYLDEADYRSMMHSF